MIDGLTETQARMLLSKHVKGSFDSGPWKSIAVLITLDYIKDVAGDCQVTPKGVEWCDRNHLDVGLFRLRVY